jgi:hypothetical protein
MLASEIHLAGPEHVPGTYHEQQLLQPSQPLKLHGSGLQRPQEHVAARHLPAEPQLGYAGVQYLQRRPNQINDHFIRMS